MAERSSDTLTVALATRASRRRVLQLALGGLAGGGAGLLLRAGGFGPAPAAADGLWAAVVGSVRPAEAARPPRGAGSGPEAVGDVLAQLTLEQRVGQLFMVGLQSGAPEAVAEETNETIRALHAGNVVLYGTGWNGSSVIRAATRPLQALAREANGGVGLLISGNQEGGQWGAFQAFYGVGFSLIPSPISQAQGDPARLQEQARIWGVQLRNVGVNLNLAPALDTVPAGTTSTNDPIGFWGREYGYTPEEVTEYGVAFARGMREAGIAVSIKHFPGLGRVRGNTDFTAEGIEDDDFTGLDDPYLQPYQAAIDAGVELVMMSSAIYPRVDSQRALFSPVIMGEILRQGKGFEGVIVTDDVGQAAALADVPPAQRALDFLRAGGDLVLTVLPSDIAPMTQAVLAEIDADPAFHAQIETSVERVLRVKAALGLLPERGRQG